MSVWVEVRITKRVQLGDLAPKPRVYFPAAVEYYCGEKAVDGVVEVHILFQLYLRLKFVKERKYLRHERLDNVDIHVSSAIHLAVYYIKHLQLHKQRVELWIGEQSLHNRCLIIQI